MMPDREKVIVEIEDALSGNLAKAGHVYKLSLNGLKDKALIDALVLLKEQEAVVRCKDCIHWDYRTDGCMHLTGRIAPIVKTGADWYCCDGERKDT